MTQTKKNFNEHLAELPVSTQGLYRAARKWEDTGFLDKATKAFETLASLHSDVAGFWMYLGQCYLKLRRLDEAVGCFQKVITLEPDNRFAHSSLGHVNNELGRYDAALRHLSAALSLNPAHAGTYNNLGRALSQGYRRFDDAKNCFVKAIHLDPDFDIAYNNLAAVHYELGEYDKAMDYYRQALRLNPKYPLTHNNLGLIYMRTGELGEAVAHFRKAIGIDSNYVTAHYNLGCAYLSLKKREAVIDQIGVLAKLDKDSAEDLLATYRETYRDLDH